MKVFLFRSKRTMNGKVDYLSKEILAETEAEGLEKFREFLKSFIGGTFQKLVKETKKEIHYNHVDKDGKVFIEVVYSDIELRSQREATPNDFPKEPEPEPELENPESKHPESESENNPE